MIIMPTKISPQFNKYTYFAIRLRRTLQNFFTVWHSAVSLKSSEVHRKRVLNINKVIMKGPTEEKSISNATAFTGYCISGVVTRVDMLDLPFKDYHYEI